MTIRKLVNSYVFDFPICFPVPIMGLETFDGIVYCFIHTFLYVYCSFVKSGHTVNFEVLWYLLYPFLCVVQHIHLYSLISKQIYFILFTIFASLPTNLILNYMAAEILLEINGHKYNASGFSYDFTRYRISRENLLPE